MNPLSPSLPSAILDLTKLSQLCEVVRTHWPNGLSDLVSGTQDVRGGGRGDNRIGGGKMHSSALTGELLRLQFGVPEYEKKPL